MGFENDGWLYEPAIHSQMPPTGYSPQFVSVTISTFNSRNTCDNHDYDARLESGHCCQAELKPALNAGNSRSISFAYFCPV